MTRRPGLLLRALLALALLGGVVASPCPTVAAGVSANAPQKLFIRENDLTARLRAWSHTKER